MCCDVSVTASFKTTFVSFLVEMSVLGEGKTGFTKRNMLKEKDQRVPESPQ